MPRRRAERRAGHRERPRFALLDEGLGDDVAGVLGVPLFERAIVALDDRSGAVTLHDPARFRGEDLQWQPLARDGSAACVRGRVLRERGGPNPCGCDSTPARTTP